MEFWTRSTVRIPQPERIFSFLTLICLVGLLSTGCAKLKSNSHIIWARSEAPIQSIIVAPGDQRRAVPWSDRVLRQSVSFRFSDEDMELSPGSRLGIKRLEARQSGRTGILRELAALPAGEAPPGERGRLTMKGFSQRSEFLKNKMNSLIEEILVETVEANPTGGVVVLELPLERIAEFVLLEGGGFLPTDPLLEEQGPERRAREMAMREARRELLQRIVQVEIDGDYRIANWLQENPNRLDFLQEELLSARVNPSRSGIRDWPDGRFYQVMLEFDPTDLVTRIRESRDGSRQVRR